MRGCLLVFNGLFICMQCLIKWFDSVRLKCYQIISYNGNITNINNFMNLAIFLHNNKEDKESVLPLPLAPVYCLPEHRWYFSSPSFVPLRKRR